MNYKSTLLKYILPVLLFPVSFAYGSVSAVNQTTPTAADSLLSEEQQRKFDYFFLEATNLKAKGEMDAAFELYKHCISINPNASSALYEISQFYLYLNQVPLGQDALEKAARHDPSNYWYQDALAALYRQQNKNEEALVIYENISENFTGQVQVEALMNLADIYSRLGNTEKQILSLNRLEDILGKNEQISMEKFRIYVQQDDTTKALNEIESLVKEYPLDMRYLTLLGDVYMQQGKTEEGLATFQQVLDSEPNNPAALLSIANYYNQNGEQELYDQQVEKILLNEQVEPAVKVEVMRYLISKSEAEKSDSTYIIGMFDRIIEQDMDDTQVPMLYVQYLLLKKMEDATIPVLEHILQLDPANTAARMTLLGTAIRRNDSDWVIRIAEPALELNPDAIDFAFYLGLAYYQKEQYENALTTYKSALENMPPNTRSEIISDFYSMMGDIYHTIGQPKQMYAVYDSALVYNPENIGALNNYAYYLSLEKRDLDKAEEMSYKTIKAEPNNATFLDTYAWVLFVKGNYSEARIYIDNALQHGDGKESAEVIEHAGDIYYMTDDKEKALEFWQQSLDMGNESKTLKNKIRKKKYIPEKK